MRFNATIEQSGKTATGIRVPEGILNGLGQGKRPGVVVTFAGGYSFRTTVRPHAGAFYIPVSAAVRQEAGVEAGEDVEVQIEVDTAPRDVVLPVDLATALGRTPAAKAWFGQLTDAQRKGFVVFIEVVPPARLAATEVFDAQSYPGESVVSLELVERAGLTTLTTTVHLPSPAARDQVLRYPMVLGFGQAFERLAGGACSTGLFEIRRESDGPKVPNKEQRNELDA